MKSKIKLYTAIILLTISLPTFSYSQTNQNTVTKESRPSSFEKIETLLRSLSENNKFMGSLTLRKNDKIVFDQAYGYSDINNHKLAKKNTKYRIGSISKIFTSVIIFQLIEENKLTLDTKLSNFFPEITNSDLITISNLLNHRSGIYNFTNDKDYLTWNNKPKSQEEMLKIINKGGNVFNPDEKADYSNSNYIILGYIIEKLTKKSYALNLKERITDKIGLNDTYFGSAIKIADNESNSYYFENKKWFLMPETDMSIPHGAGAIVSTANDLTLFISRLFKGDFISKNSLTEMTTIKDDYGRGIFKVFFEEQEGFGHSGAIDAFHSVLTYFPKEDLSIAITSNGLNYLMNNIGLGVLSLYFGKDYEMPSFKIIIVKPELLQKYSGLYSSKDFPLEINIKIKGEELYAQATGQSELPLEALSENEFKFEPAGVLIKFFSEKQELILKQNGASFIFKKKNQ